MLLGSIGNNFLQGANYVHQTLVKYRFIQTEGPPQKIVSFTNDELDQFGIVSALTPLENREAADVSRQAEVTGPFPKEIWKMIAEKADMRTQLSIAGTCKALREISDIDNVTRNLFMAFTTREGQEVFLKMLKDLLDDEVIAMESFTNMQGRLMRCDDLMLMLQKAPKLRSVKGLEILEKKEINRLTQHYQSLPAIRDLTLFGEDITYDDLVSFSKIAPNLRKLHIKRCDFAQAPFPFFERFEYKLLTLETLTLGTIGENYIISYSDFLKGFIRTAPNLKDVYFKTAYEIYLDLLSELAEKYPKINFWYIGDGGCNLFGKPDNL